MKPRADQSPDDYRLPLTPDGAVEFAPDPETGEEQIDLHMSQLDRMARDAINLAEPSHLANPEQIDTRRVEFGGTIIDAANRFSTPEAPAQLDMTQPSTLIAHGTWIVQGLRRAKLDEQDNQKAA